MDLSPRVCAVTVSAANRSCNGNTYGGTFSETTEKVAVEDGGSKEGTPPSQKYPHLSQSVAAWPFTSQQAFAQWFSLQPKDACHCVITDTALDAVDGSTGGRPVGMISLVDNRPYDLTIRISNIWLTPAYQSHSTHAGAGKKPLFAQLAMYMLIKWLFTCNSITSTFNRNIIRNSIKMSDCTKNDTDITNDIRNCDVSEDCTEGYTCGYRRIVMEINNSHKLSKKFASKCGFKLEGVLRKNRIQNECSEDTCVYSIVNSDWSAIESNWRRVLKFESTSAQKRKEK